MSVTSSGCASRSAARSTLPRRADFVAAPLLPVHERVHIAFRDIEIPLQVSPRREERRRIESEPPAFEQVMQGSIPLAQAVRTLVPLLVKQHRCPDFPEHPFQRQRCDFHGDLPRCLPFACRHPLLISSSMVAQKSPPRKTPAGIKKGRCKPPPLVSPTGGRAGKRGLAAARSASSERMRHAERKSDAVVARIVMMHAI